MTAGAGPRVAPPPSRVERAARGRSVRERVPLGDHGALADPPDRPDPVDLLESQARTRVAELVPIRYGRMLASPFTFYRGAALLMADDLGRVPNSGLTVQLCGDAHLSNFGIFGTPERRLVFDANDFDETLPGPFEWDVKRLAASLEVAGRSTDTKAKVRRKIVVGAVAAYRTAMHDLAAKSNLDVWYSHLDIDEVIRDLSDQVRPAGLRRVEAIVTKARSRDSRHAFEKLATMVDGEPRIAADPPLVVPIESLLPDADAETLRLGMADLLDSYRSTLQTDRQYLFNQFRLVHLARKVVGVGSVGTRAWILLLIGSDDQDALFLQAKEAQASVLEAYAGASQYSNHGQRVVTGQHLMQASSDLFLGWETMQGVDGDRRDFYIRQLRDWKGSIEVDEMRPPGFARYAELCGWTLARAHARSGDRVALAAYLGHKDTFDHAVADFAAAYADQNERDHAALRAAVADGRVTAELDI